LVKKGAKNRVRRRREIKKESVEKLLSLLGAFHRKLNDVLF